MNREQIIQMAREYGTLIHCDGFTVTRGTYVFDDEELERFAASIRAATKEEISKICVTFGDNEAK